ncbi:MAG: alkaline phosphatase family protein [Deltaproteobacteria bacterium]
MFLALTLFTLVLLSGRFHSSRFPNLKRKFRSFSWVTSRTALSLVLVATAIAPARADVTPERKPKLVVIVVVDQLRRSDLDRLAPWLTGGFKRLRNEAAVIDGHYGQQNTYTGPGHALIASGSYGYLNGIFQNKWFNRVTNRSEGMLFDPQSKPIGMATADFGDDTSPRNLLGSTVGDELKMATGGAARVVALALKERGALLLGGHLGTAYFFVDKIGEMTSSTYYMQELPTWVKAFNAQKIPDKAFGTTWERALPVAAYTEPDDQPWESDALGLGRTFPHRLDGKEKVPGQKFYEAFTTSPAGIDYTFDFARAAVNGEQLGSRGTTDILAVSVSPPDLIGHAYGNYAQETVDALARTDRALGEFFKFLDGKLGKDGWIAAITADHGASMPPEEAKKLELAGERTKKARIKAAVTAALDARFGKGDWVVALEDPSIYLNRKLIDERKLDPMLVEEATGEALLTVPGFVGYVTRSNLLRGFMPPTAAARAIARSYFPARAGEVVAVQAPFSYWGKYGETDFGGSHGSFYRYDTDVPLFLYGAPFRAGYYGQAEMVDLAATLARLLGISLPAACEGKPLIETLVPHKPVSTMAAPHAQLQGGSVRQQRTTQ